jgi:hypothetical protein
MPTLSLVLLLLLLLLLLLQGPAAASPALQSGTLTGRLS